eukprot:scaffold61144_cov61-Phaeocystis_antarctica.AAC.5
MHFDRDGREGSKRARLQPGWRGSTRKNCAVLVAMLPLYTDLEPRTRTPRYTLDSESLRW